ncbi:MAG: DUF1540 domain-containing protein [Clostridiales bacterium]|nr:DUF1540 domain-containing protein [Clostridiales bacterium]
MMQNEIKGICCEVKNCKYHDKDNCCTAGHITVGTQMATNTSETKCETFECCDGGCK